MNKILRYSFVALLAMFGLNTYAGDVTIAANSSTFLASGDDYVATQDGVTITYSKTVLIPTPKKISTISPK